MRGLNLFLSPSLSLVALLALVLSGCPSSKKGAPDAQTKAAGGDAVAPAQDDPWAGRKDLIKSPAASQAKVVNLPRIERLTMANGLKVRLIEDSTWPVVNLLLVIQSGTDAEPRELRSLAMFAAMMINKGTTTRSAEQISETIDFAGGYMSAWASDEGTFINCQVLSKDLDTCLELLPDVVINPVFPEAEMGTNRDKLIASVKQVRDRDSAIAEEHGDNLLWGDAHIKGWPMTIKSVKAVSREDLQKWHKERFIPGNSILVVAGDAGRSSIKAKLDKAFGPWSGGAELVDKSYPEPKWDGIKIRLVDKPDQTQSQIRIGSLGLAATDPDMLAVELFNYTLGAGAFSSRLMKVVRSEGGKTYGARSSYDLGKDRGAFWAYTFTRNSETVPTLKLVLDELRNMRDKGPTAEELADAKSNLAGKYPIKFETAKDVAKLVLSAELKGLDENYVREFPVRVSQVSLADVRAAAKKHLHPDNLVVVIVGKAADVEPQLKAAGMKYEKVGFMEPTTATERKALAAELAAPADPALTEEGRKILDEALAAKGGAEKLRAVKDITIKGKGSIAAQGQKFDAEISGWFLRPSRRRVDIKIPMGVVTSVITEEAAWGGIGSMIRDAPAQVAQEERASLWRSKDFIFLRHLDEKDLYIQARDPVEHQGRKMKVVEMRRADGSLNTILWLDAETHLLARMSYQKKGEQAFEDYADYRAVNGLQMAFKQHQEGGDSKVELALSKLKINQGIPAGTFDRPKPAKPEK